MFTSTDERIQKSVYLIAYHVYKQTKTVNESLKSLSKLQCRRAKAGDIKTAVRMGPSLYIAGAATGRVLLVCEM